MITEWKNYVGSKIVRATPMTRNTFTLNVKGGSMDPNTEDVPGYCVSYPGGYQSWSPKNVFEEAYREVSIGEVRFIKGSD